MMIGNEIIFWFALCICPLLSLAAVYSGSYLLAYISAIEVYDYRSEHAIYFALSVLGLPATFLFIRAMAQAKQRW